MTTPLRPEMLPNIMCYFILTVLPSTACLKKIEELFLQHGLHFKPAGNPDKRILNYLEQGEYYYWTTAGMCDCNTALVDRGPSYYSRQNTDETLAKQAEKLRKKGWSEHKIEAWLSQKMGMRGKREQNQETGNAKDIASWYALLNTVLAEHLSPYIGLLVFFDDESTTIKGRVKKKLSSDFAPMEDNTILTFH
jgi:hypothetical protein